MEKVIFADYVVENEVIENNYFECAAWSETIKLNKGIYPIYAKIEYGQVKNLVWFSIPGTIVEDYFQSLCCGVPFGKSYDRNQNTGKPRNWRSSFYCHSLAKNILNGKATNIKLRPGFEARPIDFIDYRGEPCRTYGIFLIERS